jgi:hypothetical protein
VPNHPLEFIFQNMRFTVWQPLSSMSLYLDFSRIVKTVPYANPKLRAALTRSKQAGQKF